MIVKPLVEKAVSEIETHLKDENKYALLDDIQYVKEYILALERENFGLKTTVKNKTEIIEKFKRYNF